MRQSFTFIGTVFTFLCLINLTLASSGRQHLQQSKTRRMLVVGDLHGDLQRCLQVLLQYDIIQCGGNPRHDGEKIKKKENGNNNIRVALNSEFNMEREKLLATANSCHWHPKRITKEDEEGDGKGEGSSVWLVVLGDILDVGPYDLHLAEFIHRLSLEAAAVKANQNNKKKHILDYQKSKSGKGKEDDDNDDDMEDQGHEEDGDRLVLILGNHELYNFEGNFNAVHPSSLDPNLHTAEQLNKLSKARKSELIQKRMDFLSRKTNVGRYLRSRGIFFFFEEFVFVHGGLHPATLTRVQEIIQGHPVVNPRHHHEKNDHGELQLEYSDFKKLNAHLRHLLLLPEETQRKLFGPGYGHNQTSSEAAIAILSSKEDEKEDGKHEKKENGRSSSFSSSSSSTTTSWTKYQEETFRGTFLDLREGTSLSSAPSWNPVLIRPISFREWGIKFPSDCQNISHVLKKLHRQKVLPDQEGKRKRLTKTLVVGHTPHVLPYYAYCPITGQGARWQEEAERGSHQIREEKHEAEKPFQYQLYDLDFTMSKWKVAANPAAHLIHPRTDALGFGALELSFRFVHPSESSHDDDSSRREDKRKKRLAGKEKEGEESLELKWQLESEALVFVQQKVISSSSASNNPQNKKKMVVVNTVVQNGHRHRRDGTPIVRRRNLVRTNNNNPNDFEEKKYQNKQTSKGSSFHKSKQVRKHQKATLFVTAIISLSIVMMVGGLIQMGRISNLFSKMKQTASGGRVANEYDDESPIMVKGSTAPATYGSTD